MLEKYIKAAKREAKADLVLKNAAYADVFSGDLKKGDIAITDGRIVGVGEYSGITEIDCANSVALPAYIDGHVHIESSQLSPEGFASLVVPRGTTAVVADPHEIVNVCGLDGFKYILKASENLPLDVLLMLPSCVPATPFETSGATLSGEDIKENIGKNRVSGLGEFMNYTGVTGCDPDIIKKLEAAHFAGKIIDGHAPALRGYDLNAYLCGGISTDHECCAEEEIKEKISKGMYVHIRHGSSARNLDNAKYITDSNFRRFLICTDDRHADDLKEKGHIDDALRRLVNGYGIDPVRAVTLATLNAAECYGMKFRGGIAPFWLADLVIVDNLKNFNARMVIKGGKIVAENGKPLFDTSKRHLPESVLNTVHLKRKLAPADFVLTLKGSRAKAITLTSGGLVTGAEVVDVQSKNGDVTVKGTDILKLAVAERHKRTGNIGKALLKGYGFKGGAMGITIAHDSHNIILLGDDNAAMASAANALKEMGGGMVIAESSGKIYSVPLEIGGLMSTRDADGFCLESRALTERAYAMGVKREYDAFMSLAFLSLAVIPKLKLLDTGLFDVEKFGFTDIEE